MVLFHLNGGYIHRYYDIVGESIFLESFPKCQNKRNLPEKPKKMLKFLKRKTLKIQIKIPQF
jgi:hypothetical protein